MSERLLKLAFDPQKYNDENHSWGESSVRLFDAIEYAAKEKKRLLLDEQAVDRLSGILWQLGVFK